MVIMFLVLGIGETVQGMPAASGKGVSFQIGFGMAPAIMITLAVAALILLLGGVYYVTSRMDGATSAKLSSTAAGDPCGHRSLPESDLIAERVGA